MKCKARAIPDIDIRTRSLGLERSLARLLPPRSKRRIQVRIDERASLQAATANP
jgi:hypothetical protein